MTKCRCNLHNHCCFFNLNVRHSSVMPQYRLVCLTVSLQKITTQGNFKFKLAAVAPLGRPEGVQRYHSL